MNPISIHHGFLLLLGLVATGCQKKAPLYTEGSSAAIRSAEELGASELPQAALHLQFAREALQAATDLNADKKKDEANSMLLRAEADAELAIALSRADAERTEAEAAMTRVHELQAENPYAPGSAP